MKTQFIASALSSVVLATSALAAAEQPVLTRTSNSGFVPPSLRRSISCQIYEDRIEITQMLGGVTSQRVITQRLGGNVQELIHAAAQGPFTQGHFIPDAGSMMYSANAQDGQNVVLKSSGFRSVENGSTAANTLANFIDLACGN
jgi:hypothetical protein